MLSLYRWCTHAPLAVRSFNEQQMSTESHQHTDERIPLMDAFLSAAPAVLVVVLVVVVVVAVGWLQMYILTREPPSQSSAEDLPPAEPFRETLTMAGSAESPSFCRNVMSNTSKSEKTLSEYETPLRPGTTQTSLSLVDYWCVKL